jgi:hypothetical protein
MMDKLRDLNDALHLWQLKGEKLNWSGLADLKALQLARIREKDKERSQRWQEEQFYQHSVAGLVDSLRKMWHEAQQNSEESRPTCRLTTEWALDRSSNRACYRHQYSWLTIPCASSVFCPPPFVCNGTFDADRYYTHSCICESTPALPASLPLPAFQPPEPLHQWPLPPPPIGHRYCYYFPPPPPLPPHYHDDDLFSPQFGHQAAHAATGVSPNPSAQHPNPLAQAQLPAGWTMNVCDGRPFYTSPTGQSQWDLLAGSVVASQPPQTAASLPPAAALPPGWMELTDPKSYKTFYVNTNAFEITWDRPGGVELQPAVQGVSPPAPSAHGTVYQQQPPLMHPAIGPLPAGWREEVQADDRVMYVHDQLDCETFTRPSNMAYLQQFICMQQSYVEIYMQRFLPPQTMYLPPAGPHPSGGHNYAPPPGPPPAPSAHGMFHQQPPPPMHPAGPLPAGWREEVQADGRVMYVHDQLDRQTFTRPFMTSLQQAFPPQALYQPPVGPHPSGGHNYAPPPGPPLAPSAHGTFHQQPPPPMHPAGFPPPPPPFF